MLITEAIYKLYKNISVLRYVTLKLLFIINDLWPNTQLYDNSVIKLHYLLRIDLNVVLFFVLLYS